MKKVSLFLSLLLIGMASQAQKTGIIPEPQQVEQSKGKFIWNDKVQIHYDENDTISLKVIQQIENELSEITGFSNSISSKKIKKNQQSVVFQLIDNLDVKENKDQGYIINITPSLITIEAETEQGLFYGGMSLKQIIRYQYINNGKQEIPIPCMRIIDWPSIAYRGWMDDISRGPVPTMDFIKKEIRTLAEYKMNFFNLYTEHLFKLESHPDIAPTDGLTAEEIKELSEYAKTYHVEFIGNQQCFAHAEKTLRIPFYDNILDTKANFNPGTEETYRFLEDLFSEVAPAYESNLFNINCDETEGLGSGKAHDYVSKIGTEKAYCQHINRVNDILKKYGKDVMMWGDIIGKNPLMINELPEDMQFIVWSYGAGDDYSEMIKPFKESGHKFWIAPGASMWGTCFPDIQTYTKNIANFSRDGYLAGTQGVINTAWDDSGESLFNSAFHSMVWCAEMSWKPIQNVEKDKAEQERKDREADFNKRFNIQYFNSNEDLVSILYATSDLIHDPVTSKLMSFGALNESLTDFYPNQIDSSAIARNTEAQEKTLQFLENLNFDKNFSILDNAKNSIFRVYVTASKNLFKAQLYNTLQNSSEENIAKSKMMATQVLDSLRNLKYDYVKIWDYESRAYSRDIVTNRYDKIAKEILDFNKKVFINTELQDTHSFSGDARTRQLHDGVPVVSLKTIFNDRPIYYTIDGSNPGKSSSLYEEPFKIERSCIVKAISYDENGNFVETERYVLYHKGMGHLKKLNSPAGNYRPEYSGGGDNALLNGAIGGNDYKDGNWQGFYGVDTDIEIDFGKKETINELKINFLANPYDWILLPKELIVYTSKDGNNYQVLKSFEIEDQVPNTGNSLIKKSFPLNETASRFLKIIIKNPGQIPQGLPGHGFDSWIFMDEIIID